MSSRHHYRFMLAALLGALVGLFALRYLAAIDSGVDHTVAIRTYAFWAAVCVPVAVLSDILVRTFCEYQPVRMAAARVRGRR